MELDFKPIFDAAKKLGARFRDDDDVDLMNAAIKGMLATPALPEVLPPPPIGHNRPPKGPITTRVALELLAHEGMVLEAYKDSKGIWTWGIGVTNMSGHEVYPRYKDKPQTIRRVLEIYIWLLENRYLPAVLKEFAGHELSEAQLAAALSFHYNSGRIAVASWCDDWKAGRIAEARAGIMQWKKPPEIIERRKKERDLFFDGRWSSDGKVNLYEVNKPSYTPRWGSVRRIDVSNEIVQLLGG